MKHDTAKKGVGRHYVISIATRHVFDQLELLPTDMRDYFYGGFRPHGTDTVDFYAYPDGFYGGNGGRKLWKLNKHHENWVMRVKAAIEGKCEC